MEFIDLDDQTFSIINRGFKNLINYLSPKNTIPSRPSFFGRCFIRCDITISRLMSSHVDDRTNLLSGDKAEMLC